METLLSLTPKQQTLMHMKRDLKGRYHKLFRAHPAAILQHGGRQDTARHLRHLISHTKLKLLNKWIGLVIRTSNLRREKPFLKKTKQNTKKAS